MNKKQTAGLVFLFLLAGILFFRLLRIDTPEGWHIALLGIAFGMILSFVIIAIVNIIRQSKRS